MLERQKQKIERRVRERMVSGGIDIRGIRKVFGTEPGGVVALDNIDLDIKPGAVRFRW